MDNAAAKIFEALARIEHKLDCVIAAHGIAVPPMRDGSLCPCCLKKVEYGTDFGSKAITRACGCGHGKAAPMLGFKDVVHPTEGDRRGYDHTLRRQSDPNYGGNEPD